MTSRTKHAASIYTYSGFWKWTWRARNAGRADVRTKYSIDIRDVCFMRASDLLCALCVCLVHNFGRQMRVGWRSLEYWQLVIVGLDAARVGPMILWTARSPRGLAKPTTLCLVKGSVSRVKFNGPYKLCSYNELIYCDWLHMQLFKLLLNCHATWHDSWQVPPRSATCTGCEKSHATSAFK